MHPKFDSTKSFVPRPGRLGQADIPVPACWRAYSYFLIDLPSDVTAPDLFDACPADLAHVLRERADLAIVQAHESSHTWKAPAWWDVLYDDGNQVTVRRISPR